jgi:hypothetical protein
MGVRWAAPDTTRPARTAEKADRCEPLPAYSGIRIPDRRTCHRSEGCPVLVADRVATDALSIRPVNDLDVVSEWLGPTGIDGQTPVDLDVRRCRRLEIVQVVDPAKCHRTRRWAITVPLPQTNVPPSTPHSRPPPLK